MKLEIYDEKIPAKEPVRLKLQQYDSDLIELVVVNERGTIVGGGHLMGFCSDGTVQLYPSVSPKLGFQLNLTGQIKTG